MSLHVYLHAFLLTVEGWRGVVYVQGLMVRGDVGVFYPDSAIRDVLVVEGEPGCFCPNVTPLVRRPNLRNHKYDGVA